VTIGGINPAPGRVLIKNYLKKPQKSFDADKLYNPKKYIGQNKV